MSQELNTLYTLLFSDIYPIFISDAGATVVEVNIDEAIPLNVSAQRWKQPGPEKRRTVEHVWKVCIYLLFHNLYHFTYLRGTFFPNRYNAVYVLLLFLLSIAVV